MKSCSGDWCLEGNLARNYTLRERQLWGNLALGMSVLKRLLLWIPVLLGEPCCEENPALKEIPSRKPLRQLCFFWDTVLRNPVKTTLLLNVECCSEDSFEKNCTLQRVLSRAECSGTYCADKNPLLRGALLWRMRRWTCSWECCCEGNTVPRATQTFHSQLLC